MNDTDFNKNDELLLADRVEMAMSEEIERLAKAGRQLLPQQQELADRYGVSLRTIRTVVNRLKDRKVIRSIKGKGMFIMRNCREAGNVLLVTENFSDPYASMVAAVTGDELLRRGLTPVMVSYRDLAAFTGDARGMLVLGSSPEVIDYIKAHKMPYCGINDAFIQPHQFQPVFHQTVRCNSYLAGYLGTEILLRRDKEQIMFFGFHGQGQYHGYRDALRAHGINPLPEMEVFVKRQERADFEEFCLNTRNRIKRLLGTGARVGFFDSSGSMTNRQSQAYCSIMYDIINQVETVGTPYAENPDWYMASIVVQSSLKSVVSRAIDIITGKAEPYSICETHDNLRIGVSENERRCYYSVEDFFDHKI